MHRLRRHESCDVVTSRLCVRCSDPHQLADVVALEHEKAQKAGTLRLSRAEAPREKPEASGQSCFVVCGEPGKIDRGSHHEQLDGAIPAALLFRNLTEKCIRSLQPHRVLIHDVEKNGVHELPENLGGRGIPSDLRPFRLLE